MARTVFSAPLFSETQLVTYRKEAVCCEIDLLSVDWSTGTMSSLTSSTDNEDDDDSSSCGGAVQFVTDETEDDELAAVSVAASADQSSTNYVVEKHSFNERLSHYTPSNVLQSKFQRAVQAACIFEAGERVYATATKKDPDVKELFLETYHTVLSEIDDTYMDDIAREKMKILVGGRQDNSSLPMDGAKIGKKVSEFRRLINNQLSSFFPKDLATLPSGTSLNEAFDSMKQKLVDKYWKKDGKEPPEHWWYTGPVPVFLFLTVQIFRKSAHINPKTAAVDYAKSRAVMKEEKQAKKKLVADTLNELTRKKEEAMHHSRRLKAESKVINAQAYAEQVATARRQAETAEIKAELDLLDQHQALFGEEEFRNLKRQKLMQIFSRKSFQETLRSDNNLITVDDNSTD